MVDTTNLANYSSVTSFGRAKNKSWFCCSLLEAKEIYPRFIPENFSTYLKPLIIYSWQKPCTLTLLFLVGDGKWELNASVLPEQWMLFSTFHIIMSRLISQFKYWVYKKRILNMENYTSNQNILEYMFSDHNSIKILGMWNWVYIFTVFLILSWVLFWELYGHIGTMPMLLLKVFMTCRSISSEFNGCNFCPVKAHLTAEMLHCTRADISHKDFFCTGDPFVSNKILPLPELDDLLQRVMGEWVLYILKMKITWWNCREYSLLWEDTRRWFSWILFCFYPTYL